MRLAALPLVPLSLAAFAFPHDVPLGIPCRAYNQHN